MAQPSLIAHESAILGRLLPGAGLTAGQLNSTFDLRCVRGDNVSDSTNLLNVRANLRPYMPIAVVTNVLKTGANCSPCLPMEGVEESQGGRN